MYKYYTNNPRDYQWNIKRRFWLHGCNLKVMKIKTFFVVSNFFSFERDYKKKFFWEVLRKVLFMDKSTCLMNGRIIY